jgi:hypothetical protein
MEDRSAVSRTAAHEWPHVVGGQDGLRLPAWLNEGLAELFSNLEDGRSEPRTSVGQFIPCGIFWLRPDRWISLAELVSASENSEVFTSPGSVDSAYAESWLLAHMLVLDPRYSENFPHLLSALEHSETPEAFGTVYRKSVAQVEQDLIAYLEVVQTNGRVLE